MAVVSGRCPTFLWTDVEGAALVDLVVYRVPEVATGPPAGVLSVTLPGSAHGWTPSLGECLESGGRYAWSVRAGGEWSEANLFEVSAAPSVTEVEEAMAVLRRYAEADGASGQETESPIRQSSGLADTAAPKTGRADSLPLRSESVGMMVPSPRTVTPPGSYDLSISGDFDLGGYIFKDGYPLLHTDGGYAYGNVALGFNALISATPAFGSGWLNTAVGHRALQYNTIGRYNTALGWNALLNNDGGGYNTAVGLSALSKNTDSSYSTAVGFETLRESTGSNNTAVGSRALVFNTTGSVNTAVGQNALLRNDTGDYNTAVGQNATVNNDTGYRNTALGHNALRSNTGYSSSQGVTPDEGSYNTAVGDNALFSNVIGRRNTAVGQNALYSNTGSFNIAVGRGAGRNLTTGFNNIHIGNSGVTAESATIKIGDEFQTKTFIAGIQEVMLGATEPHVCIDDATDQLGLCDASSARFKENIQDMAEASEPVLELRPVRFRYTEEFVGETDRPVLYGLIAEEVAEVLPELVAYDAEGEPYTVRYQLLSSLLLNELQKQHRRIRAQGWFLGLLLLAGLTATVGRWRLG